MGAIAVAKSGIKTNICALALAILASHSAFPAARSKEAVRNPAAQCDVARTNAAARDKIVGKLPNGFRYLIVRSALEPGRISSSLEVSAGFAAEDKDQIEVAHLLEHLLASSYTDGRGMRIKQTDSNSIGAHTDDDYTEYHFKFPVSQLAFQLNRYREIAHGARISRTELDSVRATVMLEALGSPDGPGQLWATEAGAAVGDTRQVQRRAGAVQQVKLPDVLRYYRDWYRPDRETLFIVGDVNPDQVECEIARRFASIPAMPARVGIAAPRRPQSRLLAVADEGAKGIVGNVILDLGDSDAGKPKDDIENLVAASLLNAAINNLVRGERTSLRKGTVNYDSSFHYRANDPEFERWYTSPGTLWMDFSTSEEGIPASLQEFGQTIHSLGNSVPPAMLSAAKEDVRRAFTVPAQEGLDALSYRYRAGARIGDLGRPLESLSNLDALLDKFDEAEAARRFRTWSQAARPRFMLMARNSTISTKKPGEMEAWLREGLSGRVLGKSIERAAATRPGEVPPAADNGISFAAYYPADLESAIRSANLRIFVARDAGMEGGFISLASRQGLDEASISAENFAEDLEFLAVKSFQLGNDEANSPVSASIRLSGDETMFAVSSKSASASEMAAALGRLMAVPSPPPALWKEYEEKFASRHEPLTNFSSAIRMFVRSGTLPDRASIERRILTPAELGKIWPRILGGPQNLDLTIHSSASGDEALNVVRARLLPVLEHRGEPADQPAATAPQPPSIKARFRVGPGYYSEVCVGLVVDKRISPRDEAILALVTQEVLQARIDNRLRVKEMTVRHVMISFYSGNGRLAMYSRLGAIEGSVDRIEAAHREELMQALRTGLTDAEYGKLQGQWADYIASSGRGGPGVLVHQPPSKTEVAAALRLLAAGDAFLFSLDGVR